MSGLIIPWTLFVFVIAYFIGFVHGAQIESEQHGVESQRRVLPPSR